MEDQDKQSEVTEKNRKKQVVSAKTRDKIGNFDPNIMFIHVYMCGGICVCLRVREEGINVTGETETNALENLEDL